MTNICEFLDLPTRWRLSRCNKPLEKVITKDCKSLWRRIHLVEDGVPEKVCQDVLTDTMIEFLFVQVNASHVTVSINLECCHNISGLCLRQLRHSPVFERIHFARIWRNLDHVTIEDDLRTCLSYKLMDVKFPFPPPAREQRSEEERNHMIRVRHIFLRDLRGRDSGYLPQPPSCRICEASLHLGSGHCSRLSTTKKSNDASDNIVLSSDCIERVSDVCKECWSREISARVLYMETQPDLNGKMRSILVEWIGELCVISSALPDTFYLAVSLIDRYLERKTISRQKFQLLGSSSLLIACRFKEEHMHPPEACDMASYCAGAYSTEEVIEMEEDILTTLRNQIVEPTAYDFLASYMRVDLTDKRVFQLASYLLESTLLSYDLNRYLPSQLAAAALLIAERSIAHLSMESRIFHCTNYSEADIAPVARAVLAAKESLPENLRQLDRKYSRDIEGAVTDIALYPILNFRSSHSKIGVSGREHGCVGPTIESDYVKL